MPIYSGAIPVWAYKSGELRPKYFSGDQTGIQGAFDYVGSNAGSKVWLGPGTASGLTNFTVFGKTMIEGGGPLTTSLIRSSSATGNFFREKTGAEGNASGATGVVMRNIGLYGNGSAGDGINFGNQGGASFNSLAYLSDILVRDFPTGTAVNLNANAIHCRDVWGFASLNGFKLTGGANHISGLWTEDNTGTQVIVQSPWNTFDHVQIEQHGSAPSGPLIDVTGGSASENLFNGVYMDIGTNLTQLIILRSGCSKNMFTHVRVNSNAHTWTNTIYVDVWTSGTGMITPIMQFTDFANNSEAWDYDQSDNTQLIRSGAVIADYRFGLTDAATIAVDASKGRAYAVTLAGNRTMGAPTNPRTGQRISFEIIQDGTGGRTLAWNAAFKHAWVDTGNTLSKRSTIDFRYNGANWVQVGAQSPYF